MALLFDVFGKKMSVHREGDDWLLFSESETGIRARVYDVVIPSDVNENELANYLDDIYHEYANEKHTSVIRVS